MAAYDKAPAIIQQVSDEFADLTGRRYGFAEEYRLDDADMVMVLLGSSAGTCKDVIDEYREKGVKVGLLKLRTFRPFPAAYLAKVLSGRKAVCVLDRSASFGGQGGPLFMETRSAMYGLQVPVHGYIYGLGGRDFDLRQAADRHREPAEGRRRRRDSRTSTCWASGSRKGGTTWLSISSS